MKQVRRSIQTPNFLRKLPFTRVIAIVKGNRKAWTWQRALAWVCVFGACCLIVDYVAFPYGAAPGGRSGNQGENGLWLRYTWYFGTHSAADTQELAAQLQDHQIAFAYCHVRSVEGNGSLKYHDPVQAAKLIKQLHHGDPGVKVIAWIYAGNAQGDGTVNLSRPQVRSAMAREARWLTTECGFDGVQWDYEICSDGDQNFLALLQETRQDMPPGKILSVAAALWLPKPLTHWGWSAGYFQQVARVSDQIVVMGYDSGMYLPRGYVALMAQQVSQVTQAAGNANADCRVLIGIPTYGHGGLSHNAHAENIGMALRGVREGLADPKTDRDVFDGVAIFANYTTQTKDWRIYERLWLGKR